MRRGGAVRIGLGTVLLTAALWHAVAGASAQLPPILPPGLPSTLPGGLPLPGADPGQAPLPTPVPIFGAAETTTTTTVPSSPGLPAFEARSTAPRPPGLDLSDLAALRDAARGKGPRVRGPDGGYRDSLPFRQEQSVPVGEQAQELGAAEEEAARVRSLSAVAGGLVAMAILMHLLWLLRQVRRAPMAGGRVLSPLN